MKTFSLAHAAAYSRMMVAALVAAAGSSAAHGQCTGFGITSSTGAVIVPGTVDIGNHTDDLVSNVALPFPVSLYGTSYNNVGVSTNGNLQFTTAANAWSNACLPSSNLGVAIVAHWDDLLTDRPNTGIFTSVSGAAPNRVFNIEWRTVYRNANTTPANFQVRLYEDNSKFEFIYGSNSQGGTSATVGVQRGTLASNQYECNQGGLSNGLMLTFTPINSSTVLCASVAAAPASVNNCSGASTLLTMNVTPGTSPASTGIAVVGNLTAIGGLASQPFYNDGTHGDAVAGDSIHSFAASVPSSVTSGSKAITMTASDDQGRTGTGTTSVLVNCVTGPNPTLGPDVYTYNITDVPRWGTNAEGDITAYSVGTTSSNIGDYPVLWVDSNNYLPDYNNTQHPVISQNMYRLKKYGAAPAEYWRFEHLGQSWLKHGFVSTNSNCGSPAPTQMWRPSMLNYQTFGGDVLGVNCTDTYGGGLNGNQSYLGPKSIVNATRGDSPFIRDTGTGHSTIRERLQVRTSDVTSQPSGTRFFVDAYYVTADDSQFVRPGETVAFNAMNNASWREVNAASINGSPSFAGSTQLFNPGIFAWKAVDSTVALVTADHDDAPNPGTGFKDVNGNPNFPNTTIRSRYWAAAKATALGGGLYRYEYAVYNHNSDRSAGSVSVPMPAGAAISDVTFNAPFYHSGEPYSNAPWTTTRSGTSLTFRTESFSANANANALRWGCLYNFGFTANVAPTTGAATIALFKPGATAGAPAAVNAAGLPVPTMPAFCGPADLGIQGGAVGQDNALNNNDFVVFINLFFDEDSRADFGSQGGVPGADGQFDNNDFVVFIDQFFAGC